MRWVLRQQ